MSIQEQDWIIERKRLERVRKEMDREMTRLEGIVDYRQSEVLDIRRNFWDEVTVNTSDYTEVAETAASITQQKAVLSEQERSFRHAEIHLQRLQKLKPSPYFARIDFKENGPGKEEQIYIGIGSVVDEETHELLVYDWRAPVSGMFYDYTPGNAQYETPEGLIEGEMTLKRQYIIKNGQLENMFDTGINIGDEMLKYILAKNAHDKMSSIVTSIQQEQNRIIRDDRHQILIVQGAAGSGKTSVALQRVAYLLYKYRDSLTPENMVLFSPNSIFNDYVSHVLPELGETNMQQTTFQDHLDRGFGKRYAVEDAYDQLEYLLSAEETDQEAEARIRGIEWKTSLAFMELMDRYIDLLKTEGILFRPFMLRDKVLISIEQLENAFYEENGNDASISSRMDKVREWALKELQRLEERVYRNRLRKMINDPRYLGTDKEMKAESRSIARKAFEPLRQMAKRRAFIDVFGMYRRLFTDQELWKKLASDRWPGFDERVGEYTARRLAARDIPYEDATPILFLKTAFEGMLRLIRIKQVIIDEAQDYSPFQLEYLRRLFPRARFTLLGDLNQGIYHANVQSYKEVGQLFGEADVGIVRMAKSYRSTTEIIDFTKRILREPEPVESIGRTGQEPQVIRTSEDQIASAAAGGIQSMREQGAESIAVICKTERETKDAYEALQQILTDKLHLLTKDRVSFVSGIVVIPAYLAKGLEFDGVIVYNAGHKVYGRESERKLLYTACTRAMHHLHVYYTGGLTTLIDSAVRT